jgi:hypothetical protein
VVKKGSIFCDITLCSPLKVNRRFGETCPLYLQGRRKSQARNQSLLTASCLAYLSTLKMEATCSSERSVDFQQITGRYIIEDRHLQIKHFLSYYQEICILLKLKAVFMEFPVTDMLLQKLLHENDRVTKRS